MLNAANRQDRSGSPVRRYAADSDGPAQGVVVQKRLRSPRPAKKRQGPGLERQLDSSVATCSYGDDETKQLSQLSDLVILDASQDPNLSQEVPVEVASQHFPSQEGQDAVPASGSQIMLEAPPSQPDIPLATLADSRPQAASPQEEAAEAEHPFSHYGLPVQQAMVPQRLAGISSPSVQGIKEEGQQPLHPKSRATRRGPMDEMRQLVRILVKVIPHSVALISSSEEGGGGNRISEEQIKSYLDNALGDAPRPMWGLPGGWGDYCSTLFSWVANRPITVDQAMRCAKREPGRSWEALEPELNKLGLFPQTWPLPLTRQGLLEAAQNPIPQAVPTGPVCVKRQPSYHNQDGPPAVKSEKGSRRKISAGALGAAPTAPPADSEMDRLSEAEVWNRVLRLIEVAKQKQGTSSAEDTVTVNSAQVRAQKLMQELAMSRAGLVMSPGMPAAVPAPSLPGAFARPATSGPAGHMALVPVMLQNADGSLTAAYQVQPVPTAGFATEGFPADGQFPGLGGAPVIAAPSPNSMNLLMQPGSGSSAFQTVQQHAKPMLTGGVSSPQGRSIAKPQPIRPRIGALPASAPLPSRTLNGFHADEQRAGSASPSTQDNDEEPRDFDIGSILRPTPMKPESVRRIGESQEAASPALPIHSLHTPDLATLQGSQGMATSLSALQNNLHSQTWQQHAEEPTQQDGAGQRAAAPAGPSQQASQQSPAPVQSPNGAARHSEHGPEVGLAHQQQHSQQGLQPGDAGSQQAPTVSGQGSQQQVRAPKRKLPFSVGLQPDSKRQSPGPDQAAVPMQTSQNNAVPLHQPSSAAQAASVPANQADKLKAASQGFASPHKSPLYQSNVQLMSPSVLLLPHKESPSNGKQNNHSQGTASMPSQWQLSQQC